MSHEPRTQPEDGDEGKDVVGTDGETIGIVSAVKEGTLYVEVDPGLVGSLVNRLGWGTEDGSKPIPDGRIERIDEEVVIRTTEEIEAEHGEDAETPVSELTGGGSDATAPAGKYEDAEPGEQIEDPDPTGMEDPGAGVPGTGDPGRVDPEEERPEGEEERPEADDGSRPEEPGGPGGATDDR
jgi:hypothetical protein